MHKTVSPILINEEEEEREKWKGNEIKTDSYTEYVKGSYNHLSDFLWRNIEFGDWSGGHEKFNLW